jgi:hypothetical protein
MSKAKKVVSPPKRTAQVAAISHTYALEQLYTVQDHDWVVDTIAPVLAWVPGSSKARSTQPFAFFVEHTAQGRPMQLVKIDLTWNLASLAAHDAEVEARAYRMSTSRTVDREHLAENAAYGLTLVAMAVLMPGVRVKAMNSGSAPDFLFDITPGAVRGVETAGRSTGGRASLVQVRNGARATAKRVATGGKAAQLLARTDIAEVHLSLWCAAPRTAIMERVKP